MLFRSVYPADHRSDAQRIIAEGGFVATEYTSKSVVHKGNFLARNRIVAGIADVTVVVESDMRGGAMSTARMASAYGREVMALPGLTIYIVNLLMMCANIGVYFRNVHLDKLAEKA